MGLLKVKPQKQWIHNDKMKLDHTNRSAMARNTKRYETY